MFFSVVIWLNTPDERFIFSTFCRVMAKIKNFHVDNVPLVATVDHTTLAIRDEVLRPRVDDLKTEAETLIRVSDILFNNDNFLGKKRGNFL